MKIQLPEKVNTIIQTLQEHGYEAYAVGGCVRDSLLGREPGDWDITTSASPDETKKLFARTVDTGIEHGTVTVLLGKEGFEVTTYRIDGKYEDSRHPTEVIFTRNLREDTEGIVDIFGGMDDLKRKIIRCVGNARERFGEDALRIMRGVRFAAQLGFSLEKETKEAMTELAPTLEKISAERIQTELVKLLVSDSPELIREAYHLGVTAVILPEFDEMMRTGQETKYHRYDVGEHTVQAVCNVPPDKVLRLTMLLHDVAKPEMKTVDADGTAHFKGHDIRGEQKAKEILRRLKFDNDTIHKVTKLVRWHDYRMPAEKKNVRKAMSKISAELFPMYLLVKRADILAHSMYRREEELENLSGLQKCYEEIVADHECVSLKQLAVTGTDLIGIGMKPGKQIGEVLNELLRIVLEYPEFNNKEHLLRFVQNRFDI